MSKLLPIGATARAFGVSTSTLRRWEAGGRLARVRTEGGQRRYDLAALRPGLIHEAIIPRRTVAYARVSSHDQRTHGSGSHKNQKLLDGVRDKQDASC